MAERKANVTEHKDRTSTPVGSMFSSREQMEAVRAELEERGLLRVEEPVVKENAVPNSNSISGADRRKTEDAVGKRGAEAEEHEDAKDWWTAAEALEDKANLEERLGRMDDAADTREDAVETWGKEAKKWEDAKRWWFAARSLTAKAKLEGQLGRKDDAAYTRAEAVEMYGKEVEKCKNTKDWWTATEALKAKARLEEKLGREEDAAESNEGIAALEERWAKSSPAFRIKRWWKRVKEQGQAQRGV